MSPPHPHTWWGVELMRGGTAPPPSLNHATHATHTERSDREYARHRKHLSSQNENESARAPPSSPVEDVKIVFEDVLQDATPSSDEESAFHCHALDGALKALEASRRPQGPPRGCRGAAQATELRLNGVGVQLQVGGATLTGTKRNQSARVKKVKVMVEKKRRYLSASAAGRRRREQENVGGQLCTEQKPKVDVGNTPTNCSCQAEPRPHLRRFASENSIAQTMGGSSSSCLPPTGGHRPSNDELQIDVERPPSRQSDAFPCHLTSVEDLLAHNRRRDAFQVEINEVTQEHIKSTAQTVSQQQRPPSRHKPLNTSLYLDSPPDTANCSRPEVNSRAGRGCLMTDNRNDNPERDGFTILDDSSPCPFKIEVTREAEPTTETTNTNQCFHEQSPYTRGGAGNFASLFDSRSAYSSLTIDTQNVGPQSEAQSEPRVSQQQYNAADSHSRACSDRNARTRPATARPMFSSRVSEASSSTTVALQQRTSPPAEAFTLTPALCPSPAEPMPGLVNSGDVTAFFVRQRRPPSPVRGNNLRHRGDAPASPEYAGESWPEKERISVPIPDGWPASAHERLWDVFPETMVEPDCRRSFVSSLDRDFLELFADAPTPLSSARMSL